jgi:hypothetical protein
MVIMSSELSFTAVERSVLQMFLKGDHPALSILRRQLALSRPARREFTGVGFYTYFDLVSGVQPADVRPRVVLSDVSATVEGLEHGAGFALFVNHGLLHMLEGYTFDEPWPTRVGGFALRYGQVPRDLSMIEPFAG